MKESKLRESVNMPLKRESRLVFEKALICHSMLLSFVSMNHRARAKLEAAGGSPGLASRKFPRK